MRNSERSIGAFTLLLAFTSVVFGMPQPETERCLDFYGEHGVSPDASFEFCSNASRRENPGEVAACIDFYRNARVSADATFSFCSKNAGTEDGAQAKACIDHFGQSGVSPDTAFKRCATEAIRR